MHRPRVGGYSLFTVAPAALASSCSAVNALGTLFAFAGLYGPSQLFFLVVRRISAIHCRPALGALKAR